MLDVFFFIQTVCPLKLYKSYSSLTLDDETEAETAQGQVSKHRLFLRLTHNVTLCDVVVELESQSKLGGVNIFFDLKEKQIKD